MATVIMPAWATKTAQETMQGDVTQIKTDVAAIKTDVAALVAKYSSIVVACVTQDDVTVTGQTVTLRGGNAEGPVYDTRPYNGQPVTFEVPRDFRYFVEVSSTLSGHFAPTTAQGTATTATVSVTLTYSDTSHITTYADVKGAMDSITSQAEGRAALVGIEIADTWTDNDGITVYQDPMIIVDVQPVKDAYGAEHLAAILMRKYATKYDIQFDAAESGEAGYATEATAVGGRYYWGYGKDYAQATTYAVNAFCGYKGGIWKCTTAVTGSEAFDPAKWSLLDAKFYSASATYAVGDYAKYGGKVYECTTAIETAEEFNADHWSQISNASYQSGALVNISLSTGASVPYAAWTAIYHTDISSSNKDYFGIGYNNWEYSAIRQYLNSDGAVGEWWNPAHVGDCPPDQLATVRGYKAGCSAALLQYAKPVQVPVYPWNQAPQYTVDVFWLPSGTQMFGAVNDNEGYTLKKVQDNCYAASGWTTANNGNCSGRVYRRVSATGSAVFAWLRSANRGSSYYAWYVYSNGALSNGNANSASTSYAGLPACAIY